jgi:hypothetical protein
MSLSAKELARLLGLPHDSREVAKAYFEDNLPTDGDVLFPAVAGTSQQLPSGAEFYKDTNGKPAWKWKWNTAGISGPYYMCVSSTNTNTLAGAQFAQRATDPFLSNGSAAVPANSSSVTAPGNWKPFYVTGTLSSNTVDLTIEAAAAGDQNEAMILACGVLDPTDTGGWCYHTLNWEDDDASAPAAGTTAFTWGYINDVTNTFVAGNPYTQTLPHHAMWGLGNNAQGLQIEWTQTGGADGDNVWISGIKRTH